MIRGTSEAVFTAIMVLVLLAIFAAGASGRRCLEQPEPASWGRLRSRGFRERSDPWRRAASEITRALRST